MREMAAAIIRLMSNALRAIPVFSLDFMAAMKSFISLVGCGNTRR